MSEPSALACSEASLAVGEPLVGTASDAPFFAAISWPKALWHPDDVTLSEGLPGAIRELGRSAKLSGRKLQIRLFQRAAGAATDRVELICADFQSARTAFVRDLPVERCADSIRAFLDGSDAAASLERPLLLVCTDGKHDRCCGKLGRSIFSALRAEARVEVAEVSHLGGHRLAANCLALPSGELYGRVEPADAGALGEALLHGRVYLPRYRGRTGLGELDQVAEAEARARFPDATEIRVGPPALVGDARIVPVALCCVDGPRRLAIRCVAREFEGIGSCGDARAELRERWIASSVQEERT